jgi:hypothetical protein
MTATIENGSTHVTRTQQYKDIAMSDTGQLPENAKSGDSFFATAANAAVFWASFTKSMPAARAFLA